MKTITTALILLIAFTSNAQDFKFGKVSKEELQQKFNSKDSSANATVLYKNEKISFQYIQGEGFLQIREVLERIKIYNKEGFNWATKKLRLYNQSNSSKESLTGLKGYTYNLINGKIEDDKLKKNGIFEEISNKYWKIKSFTMPNIKEGCVIEYTYQIRSPFNAIDDINFQYTIPINNFDLSVKTPEYFIYNKLLNPKSAYIPSFDYSKTNKTETLSSKERSGYYISKTNYSQSKLEYYENVITSSETNIPALKEEPFVDNLDNYRSKLVMELTVINFPNTPLKQLASSWESVTKSIYDNVDFGTQLDKKGYFDDDVDKLIAGINDPIKKVQLVYNHVKSKVKWNDYYGFTTESGVRKAYKEGTGNIADINLMLIAMLRYAGFRANPVLLSTKNNGVPLFPTRSGFNYVICFVEDEGMNLMLDATDDNSTFNLLPKRVLNWQGRVIREQGTSDWIELLPNFVSSEVISLNVKINSDLSISGKVRNQKSDYLGKTYRDKYKGIDNSEYVKELEKNKSNLVISNLKIENDKVVNEPVKITYEYEMADGVEEIGNNLYFSPKFFLSILENPFKSESRNYPIDLNYPFSQKTIINIMLPNGYEVESMPENCKYQYNGDAGSFSFLINENGNFLQLSIFQNIKTSFILAQDYPNFKVFFSKIVEKESEQIVLKKI